MKVQKALINLKCEAGKVDGGTEGQTWSEECGEKDVATVSGSAKTFVRTVPGASRASQTFGFANDVIPHHLKQIERYSQTAIFILQL